MHVKLTGAVPALLLTGEGPVTVEASREPIGVTVQILLVAALPMLGAEILAKAREPRLWTRSAREEEEEGEGESGGRQ